MDNTKLIINEIFILSINMSIIAEPIKKMTRIRKTCLINFIQIIDLTYDNVIRNKSIKNHFTLYQKVKQDKLIPTYIKPLNISLIYTNRV